MRLKQIINLLLIALFLGAFQTATIHSKHQSIETITECKVCAFTKHNTLTPHHIPQNIILENVAIARDTKKEIACVSIQRGFVYERVLKKLPVKVVNKELNDFKSPPLGYDATAPPRFS